uniref:Poly [ADP-ribose] polymerase n=1 Tax=Alexandrium monilatum TaxID=311494 RepID=A0A7S4VC97_9DINO
MMQPGTRLCEGHPSYGKGAGHFELESERYRGRTTMAVGAVVCCCTGCPCGFCLKLDERRTRAWVAELPWGQPAAAPAPMAMGAPGAAPAPAPSPGVVRVRCGGRFQVVQVQQNCNPTLWANYVRARDDTDAKIDMSGRHGARTTISCKTSETLLALPEGAELLGPLETGVNEFLLFHGTKPSACESICKSDFMVRLAGSNAGALYGPGIYFAECSSKSDEYASDDPTGIYSGLYAMLLCRVTCGRTLYTDEVHPNVDDLVRRCTVTGEYDSVLGDREKARGTYREFIVFNNDQAYPAYVIIYKRLTED